MTDYNDGNWHAWNGEGDCPVHPKSAVKFITPSRESSTSIAAGSNLWRGQVFLFRVTKEYKVPRVFWLDELTGRWFTQPNPCTIQVREVIE